MFLLLDSLRIFASDKAPSLLQLAKQMIFSVVLLRHPSEKLSYRMVYRALEQLLLFFYLLLSNSSKEYLVGRSSILRRRSLTINTYNQGRSPTSLSHRMQACRNLDVNRDARKHSCSPTKSAVGKSRSERSYELFSVGRTLYKR